MQTYSERIKQLRKRDKVSQEKLAEVIGVKRNTVSTWERGTRKPDFPAFEKMCAFFDVSLDYILGKGDDITPPKRPTQEELDELAMLSLADEFHEEVMRFARLSWDSKKIIIATIAAVYKNDEEHGILLSDPFDISVAPKQRNE